MDAISYLAQSGVTCNYYPCVIMDLRRPFLCILELGMEVGGHLNQYG